LQGLQLAIEIRRIVAHDPRAAQRIDALRAAYPHAYGFHTSLLRHEAPRSPRCVPRPALRRLRLIPPIPRRLRDAPAATHLHRGHLAELQRAIGTLARDA